MKFMLLLPHFEGFLHRLINLKVRVGQVLFCVNYTKMRNANLYN